MSFPGHSRKDLLDPNGRPSAQVGGSGVLAETAALRAEHGGLYPPPTIAGVSTAAALLRVLIARLAPEDRRVVVTMRELVEASGALVITSAKDDPMAPAMVLELK